MAQEDTSTNIKPTKEISEDFYDWDEKNKNPSSVSFREEIRKMRERGYRLAPPLYHIPHFSTAMIMEGVLPKLFIFGVDEPRPLKSHFDCKAGRVAYPVYFKEADSE